MGQIIRFPVFPPSCPKTVAALDPAERVVLSAIRLWAEAHHQGHDPLPRLAEGFQIVGVEEAALSVGALMKIVARTARHRVAIGSPRCSGLSADERHLLRATQLLQTGDVRLAAEMLRRTLLSAQGTDFALGPLQGLAGLLGQAGLFFRDRTELASDCVATAVPESPIPAERPETAG